MEKKHFILVFLFHLIQNVTAQRVVFPLQDSIKELKEQKDSTIPDGLPVWKTSEGLICHIAGRDNPSFTCGRNSKDMLAGTSDFYKTGGTTWSSGEKLYLFGGVDISGREFSDTLFEFDSKSLKWNPVQLEGEKPAGRSHATWWEDDSSLWLFGGEYLDTKTAQMQFLNDLWVWSKKENGWQQISPPKAPQNRSRSVGWIKDHKLWLYGGFGETPFADLWVYDFKKQEWENKAIESKRNAPEFRYDAHSWTNEDGLWMWGGGTFSQEKDPFIWLLRTDTLKWEKVYSNQVLDPSQFSKVYFDRERQTLQCISLSSTLISATLESNPK